MIREDQQNVRQLCELADFIDSGFQSFIDQNKLPAKQVPEAAFFCGASLAIKLLDYFRSSDYDEADVEFLTSLLVFEVNQYMNRHGMNLEWEPHVPAEWKQ